MKWTFSAILISCIFLFSRTSCDKDDCYSIPERLPDSDAGLQNPAPAYAPGDTLRVVQEVSYASFSSLPLTQTDLRRLRGFLSFYIMKIVDSSAKNFNAVSAQQVFGSAARMGTLVEPIPDNVHGNYIFSFAQDSLNNRLVGDFGIAGSEPGTYALVVQSRQFIPADGKCKGEYDIRQNVSWRGERNLHLVQAKLIDKKLKYRTQDNRIVDFDPEQYAMFFFQIW